MRERFCPRQSCVTEGGVATFSPRPNIPVLGVLVGIRSGVGDLPKYHPVALAKEERVPSLPVCSLLFRCLKHLVLDVERYILCSQNMPVTFSLRLTTAAKAMYQLGLRKNKTKTMFTALPWGFGFTFLAESSSHRTDDSPSQADTESRSLDM